MRKKNNHSYKLALYCFDEFEAPDGVDFATRLICHKIKKVEVDNTEIALADEGQRIRYDDETGEYYTDDKDIAEAWNGLTLAEFAWEVAKARTLDQELAEIIQEDLETIQSLDEFDLGIWTGNYQGCTMRLEEEARGYEQIVRDRSKIEMDLADRIDEPDLAAYPEVRKEMLRQKLAQTEWGS